MQTLLVPRRRFEEHKFVGSLVVPHRRRMVETGYLETRFSVIAVLVAHRS